MSNENHNNFYNWKSKLEELESLPGEIMPDKNAMFEKIYTRLEGRELHRKPMWYWIAAACVVFAFMISLLITNKKNHQMANTELKRNQPEKLASVATVIRKKKSITIKNPVLSEKNVAMNSDKKNEKIYKNIHKNKAVQLRVSDTVSTQNQIAEIVNDSSQAIDSSTSLVSAIPVKKRLPVVHVNELGDPDNIPQVAHNSEKQSVHFLQLASQEVYDGPTASITKNFATINFKTSPN